MKIWLRGLADLVDLRPADRASTDRCRLSILHGDRLRVFHFDLSLVLQTVAFQVVTVLSRDSVQGWTRPILGVGLSPIQPQFKPNSAPGPINLRKNGPKSGLKSSFCGFAKQNETNICGFPTLLLGCTQTLRHHSRAFFDGESGDAGADSGDRDRLHVMLTCQAKHVIHR